MNGLKSEFNSLKKKYSREQDLRPKLFMFQEKLARLKFLDPACGSGNFLTESYISLRRLENSVIELLYNNVRFLDEEFISPIKVTLSQFYGIEINDFAVSVAKAAMWMRKPRERRVKKFPISKRHEVAYCGESNAVRNRKHRWAGYEILSA